MPDNLPDTGHFPVFPPENVTPPEETQPLQLEDIPQTDSIPASPVDASAGFEASANVSDPTSEGLEAETTPVSTEEPAVDASPEQPVSEFGQASSPSTSSSTENVGTDGTSEFTNEDVKIDQVGIDQNRPSPFEDQVESDTGYTKPEHRSQFALTEEEIEERFGFHKATIEGPESSQAKHSGLRAAFKEFAGYLAQVLPTSRETSQSLTHLEDASMWAHKAIAKTDPVEGEPVYVVAGDDAERILTQVAALRAQGLQDDVMQNRLIELGLS